MTAGDLVSIESALGVTLPVAYRAAMLAYPLNPADANSQIALHDDARAVTAFNRFLRAQFPGEWEPGYYAVGNSPAGDPYFLDLAAGSPAVWSWDHETHEVAQEAADFGSWLTLQRSLERG
jgi:cell wall assembly regulator SMI1